MIEEAYQQALEEFREAGTIYRAELAKYRARKISDAEYLEARRAYDRAGKAFDEAERSVIWGRHRPAR